MARLTASSTDSGDQPDADQSLRPGRQFRSRDVARAAGSDAQVSRSENRAVRAEVVIWGTGAPRREFLHVDDLADAAVFLMRTYDSPEIVNVGTGEKT